MKVNRQPDENDSAHKLDGPVEETDQELPAGLPLARCAYPAIVIWLRHTIASAVGLCRKSTLLILTCHSRLLMLASVAGLTNRQ